MVRRHAARKRAEDKAASGQAAAIHMDEDEDENDLAAGLRDLSEAN